MQITQPQNLTAVLPISTQSTGTFMSAFRKEEKKKPNTHPQRKQMQSLYVSL